MRCLTTPHLMLSLIHILIEWDTGIPPLSVLLDEASTARTMAGQVNRPTARNAEVVQ